MLKLCCTNCRGKEEEEQSVENCYIGFYGIGLYEGLMAVSPPKESIRAAPPVQAHAKGGRGGADHRSTRQSECGEET